MGLEWAGVGHTVWQVEFNPFCRDVLAKHWPDVQRFNDVREVGAHNLEPVDVICGGYPCQPFSHGATLGGNRKRNGAEHASYLWPEFARIIGDLRPKYVVLENVRAHLSLGFGDVLGDLACLGYDAEWGVLRGEYAGVPQTRARLFVIASAARLRGPSLLDSVSLNVARRHEGPNGLGGPTPNAYDESGASRSVPLLGDRYWPEIPDRERSGTDDGVSLRLDRYHALGNAVIPQVAQIVGQRLLQIDAMT